MLLNLICAFVLLMLLLLGWIKVQTAARRFAQEHPETGPFRLVGGGCAGQGHGQKLEPSHHGKRAVPIVVTQHPETDAQETQGGCSSCNNTACKGMRPESGMSKECTSDQ
jgi:hypothetical protein